MVHLRLTTSFRSSFLSASSYRATRLITRSVSVLAANVFDIVPPDPGFNTLRESRLGSLRHALLNDENPSRVWAHYTNLLNYFSFDPLPLELHQQVLRQCSPPTHILRLSAAKRLLQGRTLEHPHLYEGRFQMIISNIRALGCTPSLQDYHFILQQFAAVGHHVGSLQVYQELIHLGLTPDPKTFGLCLQAIAHRLTLPVLKAYRLRLLAQTRKALDDLMSDMRKFQVPFTPPNLDLAIRILKETVDKEGFNALIKWTYAIDLANPDCPPLEFLESQPQTNLPCIQPLSTHALNTIIDTLGRFGDISKLVQAFEVLTQPLPNANQHLFTSFDDDDDFGVPVEVSPPPNFSPPYALPNTTTYNILLRHIGQANHATLARHYLLQAMKQERRAYRELRSQIWAGEPLGKIKAPHFAINRTMLLSAFGYTNRYKNLNLMRWLSTKLPSILRTKKRYLDYFTEIQATIGVPSPELMVDSEIKAEIGATTTSPPSQQSNSRYPLLTRSELTPNVGVNPRKSGAAFDVDIDNQIIPNPPIDKMFDINLHIRILTRDFADLSIFAQTLDRVLGRTTQRVKERLGRRVWAGKDIYLSTEDRRLVVPRGRWREIVRFQPRREIVARVQRHGSRTRDFAPHLLTQHTYFTPASVVIDNPNHPPTGTLFSKLRSFLPS